MTILFNILFLALLKLVISDSCISSSDCTTDCLNVGYITDSGSCRDPNENECLQANSANCSGNKTRCLAYGYTTISSSGDCHKPTDDECANNSVGDGNLCASADYVCQKRGFTQSSTSNQCESADTCSTTGSCTLPLTKCLYLGYVPDSNGDCITPTLNYCNNNSNYYACYSASGFCVSNGWQQQGLQNNDYSCYAPSMSYCTATSGLCSSNSDACAYIYGYVQDTNSSKCKEPGPLDCKNSSFVYTCANQNSFCIIQGWVQNSTDSSCIIDTDCLNRDKCQQTQTACQFNGFVLNKDGNACVTPTQSDCSNKQNKYACALLTNTCVDLFGWVIDPNSFTCNPPTQESCSGSLNCVNNEHACVYYYGFVNNSSNVCDQPQPSDCLNQNNIYACSSLNTFCMSWKFIQNGSSSTCTLPSTCLTDQNMCASDKSSCLYQGYIKSSTNDNCVSPLSSDCEKQSNIYACALSTNICAQQYGWTKDQSDSFCTPPTSSQCQGTNNCSQHESACVWLYGYVNNSSGVCDIPQPSDCANTNNLYACRDTNFFCRQQKFQPNNSNSACALPTTCLSDQNMCASGYSSCLYIGYIKSASNDNCVSPLSSDCQQQSNIYACALPTNACTQQYGWIKDQNASYCNPPASAQCKGTNSCSQTESACVWLYGYINNSSGVCDTPQPSDCVNSNNIYACRNSDFFCRKQNFQPNNQDSSCTLPTTCLTDQNMCASSYTSCLYQGYIKSATNDNCVKPLSSDCEQQSNAYACALTTNVCTQQYGWIKDQSASFCAPPTSVQCQGTNNCSQSESACVWLYGYTNNSNGVCDIPQPSDCANSSNLYACRDQSFFCRQQNFQPNNPDSTCALPTTCLTDQNMCASGKSSCLYIGYVKSATNDNCITPLSSDCEKHTNTYACALPTNICAQQYGWIKDSNTSYCTPPTSASCQSTNNCSQSESACVWLYGYINNSSGVCDIPQPSDCANSSNLYVCRNSSFFCRQQNFQPNNSDSTCALPNTCLTDQNMCASGKIPCLYLGYIKSQTNDNCVIPLSSDCEQQSNTYACALPTNVCTQQYGWIKDQSDSFCTPPTSVQCEGTNNCSQSESACVWLYGYINNSNGVCDTPQPSDCANSSNLYVCRDSSFFCRQQNFQPNNSNSACALPTTCLTDQNMCTSGFTSCLYLGFVKSASGNNCITPLSSDCEKQSNLYACARPTNICVQQYGWIKDESSQFCTAPTSVQCQGTNNCSQTESACVWLYGYINNSNSVCDIPEPSDCMNSNNLYVCRTQNFFCSLQNFDQNLPNYTCKLPTTCLTALDKCTSGFTACTYQGYVKSATTNQCIQPLSSDCNDQTNKYACALSSNTCVSEYGWSKDSTFSYCVPPTLNNCFGSQECNQNESACIWLYGYINNSSGNCDIPQPSDCYNTSNIYACRQNSFFCIQQNFLQSSGGSCSLPTTCLTDPGLCTPGYHSCTYQGYVKDISSNNCVNPLSSDCSQSSNAYACALPTNICVNQYGWVKDSTYEFCNPPSKTFCAGSSNCTSNESACVWYYGFVIKSSNTCSQPIPIDCLNTQNIHACRDQTTLCGQQNFLKNQSDETCKLPTTCLTDSNMCAAAYTSCTYQGYIKSSQNDNCQQPTSYDCYSQTNIYACALLTNYCVQQFGWVQNSNSNSYYCDPPDLNVCQGSSKCLNDGNACSFLYGLVNANNVCSTPNSYQCQHSAGIYGCRLAGHYCRQINFQQDTPNDSCIIPSNCGQVGGGLCSPSYQSCTIQGFVKIPSSNDCIVPSQSDCANQANTLACAQSTNQCIFYGWQQKDANNYYCVPPSSSACQQSPSCSSNETACVYQYGFNFDQNGNCLAPSTTDCLDSTKIYICNSATSYCRQLYFKKSSSNGSCVLPTDCSTNSSACSSQYTACLYQGYIKNSSNNSCKIPTTQDCSNTSNIYACAQTTNFCNVYGWKVASSSNLYCIPIPQAQCTNTGLNYCQYFQSSCQYLYGYVKSQSLNDCVVPTPFDCVNTNNIYACQNSDTFCQNQGWPKNANPSKFSCSIPTNCLNSLYCNSGQTACPYQGFVSSTTNPGICITPTDSDCLLQSNQYACAQSSNQCMLLGYIQTTTTNQYYCTSPTLTNCQSNNSCQQGLTACQYFYGLVNDFTANQCIQPADSDCSNQNNIFACRLSTFACRQQNWLAVSSTNFSCVAPSNCLSGNQCQSSYTACQYYGYVKSSSGNNCVVPSDSDCFNTSNTYLCRSDITFCTSKGWITQTSVQNSFYCIAPSYCLNQPYCGNGLTACQYIGYLSSANNICVVPGDYDCADTVNNPYLCRADITFCNSKGYIKSSTNNSCTLPTSCTGANDCASGKSACQFALGLIKSSSNNTCVAPDINTCNNNTQIYACKTGNTYCTNLGFFKSQTGDTCTLPTDCTINNQCASGKLVCLYYFGYIKSTTSNQCVQPTVIDCLNTANLYICRTGNPFCTQFGYVLNSSTVGQCQVPTNCLSGQQCGSNQASQACLYNGYIPTSSSNFSCMIPQYSDCKNPSNIELCRAGIYQQNCLNIGFVKSSSGNNCVFPASCTTGFQCATTKVVCYKLGYVKSTSNNSCVTPNNYDCSNTTLNKYSCSSDSLPTLCQSFGWIKDTVNEYCVSPSTCAIGSDCGPSMSVCQFVYGYAPDSTTNKCIIPSDSDCMNSNNLYLCKSGNQYCIQIGYQKSSNDSCTAPSNCLVGPNCSYGLTSCQYTQGYIKNSSDNTCVVPTEVDCDNQYKNLFACRLSTFTCSQKGWQKTTQLNQYYCSYSNPQDCINLSNQCSSTAVACQYKFGYVQGTSNQCKLPDDTDCINPSNIFACVPNSFCIQKGWIATAPDIFTCKSPNCLSGQWCSVQFTACTSQGFVKSLLDDSCQYPSDYDCATSATKGLQLCSATSTFCTGRGWVKNPNDNTCLPPANCLTGYQCAPNLTACNYQGFLQSTSNYQCTLPSDRDCLDNTKSLCRPGLPVNICGQKGYVQVNNRVTDYFCVLPFCLDQQNPQCGASLTACLYGGYLKSPIDDTCISPTDDQCIDQNNQHLCRVGNIPCPSRGWIRNISDPTTNQCTVPNNCLSQKYMCSSSFTACTLLGYLKSDSNDSCIAPTDQQCLDQTKQLCSYPDSPCSQKGYVQVQNSKYCQYPTNCQGQKMCAPYMTACSLQGFISDQSNPNMCKIPTATDCYDSQQNNCDPAIITQYCINMGFVKSSKGLFCEFPTDCLTGNQCAKNFVACQLKGYTQDTSKNDGVCVQTTMNICLNSSNNGMCGSASVCVTQFGLLTKSSSDLSCTIPTYQDCYNKDICFGKDSYCISNYGFIQESQKSSSCKVPKCQEIQIQCPLLCIQLGYVTNSNQKCSIPSECGDVGKGYCAVNMVACTQQGFSKSSTSDDCVCFQTIDSTGKCVQDKSNVSTNKTTSKQKLSLHILINIFILLVII